MLSRVLQQQKPDLTTQSDQSPVCTGAALSRFSSTSAPSLRHALQPSSTAATNRAHLSSVNPLKRKAIDGHGMSASRFLPIQGNGGVLNVLHGSVYFDENDFVDDDEINLDEDSPLPTPQFAQPAFTKPKVPPPTQVDSVKYPVLPTSQIEWSSSPTDHKRTPPRAKLSNREPQPDVVQLAVPPTLKEESRPEPPVKRSNLPWLNESTQAAALEQESKSYQNKRRKHVVGDNVSYPVLPEATPQPKTRNDTKFLWEKTASAVKEEQKKHRRSVDIEKKQAKETVDAEIAQPAADPTTTSKKKAKTTNKTPAKVFLSDEQKRVLELIDTGKKSVFFTGSAGTGKSVLMREIIHVLKRQFVRDGDRVAVTASTGLAACNIGGVTLHSFAGIGIGKEPVDQLIKRIKKNTKSKHRWMRTKVLIIDEISMVDGGLFDKLEEIARIIRNNGRPFGGIQLVITGDFFQLPPVPDRGQVAKFAFEAATWSTSIQHTIGLTQVFRQKDPEFANMLNEMRLGRLTDASIAKFRALTRRPLLNDGIETTELFPTRFEVDKANDTRMRALPGTVTDFTALDGGSMQDLQRRTDLLQNCMAAERISLKVGSQVMLIKNIDETLVNGSIGKITAFMDEKTYDYTREYRLGANAENEPEGGDDITKFRIKVKGAVAGREIFSGSSQKWPLVRFPLPDGTSRELLCVRESWKVELPSGEVVASRAQVPLILAWALSIHKAQGQTLEKVRVDLGKIFEKGQAYVALSRATTQEGLQILRFDPKKVMAHEKVRAFYDGLSTVAVKKLAAPKAKTTPTRSFSRDDKLFLTDDEDALAYSMAHNI